MPARAKRPRAAAAAAETAARPVVLPEREQHDPGSGKRKLDSLARLLEGAGPCTAVSVYGDQLLISANSIHGGSKDSALSTMIGSTLACLSRIALREADMVGTMKSTLIQVCLEASRAHEISPGAVERDKVEKLIRKIFKAAARPPGAFSPDKVREEIQKRALISELAREYGRNGGRQMLAVLAVMHDRSRDFFKLKHALENPDEHTRALAEALRDGRTTVLKTGKPGVHAEMRIVDHILGTTPVRKVKGGRQVTWEAAAPAGAAATAAGTPVYVGISKLCCKDCYATIKALQVKVIEERSVEEGTQISAAEAAGGTATRTLTRVAQLIDSRGAHTLGFKWEEPGCIVLGSPYREAYERIKQLMGEDHAPAADVAADVSVSSHPGLGVAALPSTALVRQVTGQALVDELIRRLQAAGVEESSISAIRASIDGLSKEVLDAAPPRSPTLSRAASSAMAASSESSPPPVAAGAAASSTASTSAASAHSSAASGVWQTATTKGGRKRRRQGPPAASIPAAAARAARTAAAPARAVMHTSAPGIAPTPKPKGKGVGGRGVDCVRRQLS